MYVFTMYAIIGIILVGYIANIVTFIQTTGITAFEIVQIIGIFIPPLGVIMGWIAIFS